MIKRLNITMTDITAWLDKLGLGKYQKIFAENEVDFDVLPKLSEHDLKELSIPLGPRKKLLEAIAVLKSGEQSPVTPKAPLVPPQAERRQLTVMFVDLVGSTALSGQLDPEDLRELILAYQNAVAGEITRFEGHVAKYMGDGVLTYFGWPQAHEDEAERAVRAGMAAAVAVAQLHTPDGRALSARIGIATGLVVVGDLIGEGAAQEQAVVGETPNLAARLQGLAEPGAVVISGATRRLLGDVFELQGLGPQSLKGVSGLVEAFQIRGERAIESRYQARRVGPIMPLMGREQELAQIMACWQRAERGEGQMMLLSGEAGIGKSRILRALSDELKGQAHYQISYQCSPYHADSAFYPVIRQLTGAAGFMAGDDDQTRLDKLETLLKKARPGTVPGDLSTALMAALLGIHCEPRYGKLNLSPQQQRARLLQALLDQLIGLAQQQPVLLVFEDVHWIDPSTRELIELISAASTRVRVLMLITTRPAFERGFNHHSIKTTLVLNRLSREPARAIVRRLSGGKALPEEVMDEIMRKTDGVPLFVEELTKTVLESGLLRETGNAYRLDGPLASIHIPSSLQDSLMARLDRLQPIREVAQAAACIGREFDYELLAAITRLDEQQLQATLAQLIEAELIFQRGHSPEPSYTFKHALVRDAAYESLLKSKRQQIHATLFNTLKAGDQAAFEILAQHATAAGLNSEGIDYWQKAGERALAQPALSEAINHLGTAIQLTGAMGDERQRLERELTLQVLLAQAWIARASYSATETQAAFRRARELSDALGGSPLLYPILYGHWVTHHGQAKHKDALSIADDVLRLAQKDSDDVPVMIAHQERAVSSLMTGQLGKARDHFETAIGLHRPAEHAWIARQFGHEQGIAARVILGAALWLLGYPEQSEKERLSAGRLALDLEHTTTTGFVYFWSFISAHLVRNHHEKQHLLELMSALAEEHNLPLWRLVGRLYRGIVVAESGDVAGCQLIDDCIGQLDGVQFYLLRPFWRSEQSRLLLAHGRVDEAQRVIRSAQSIIASTDERWNEAEAHRIEGDIQLALSNANPDAESCYRKSLEVARLQNAKSWELRTAISLARLWREQGKCQQAYDLLSPIYSGFTEGFDTADLKDAKALLNELS